ncbi:hypothetical protein K9N08_04885 [Candidatus Gracilibacteria bacterium]|nr:hypothetical protein [Candidatus Gracilibacteria bacterium]MCF7897118.1 hypothetical protein [Candidatus Gracilibacteria bacterium]
MIEENTAQVPTPQPPAAPTPGAPAAPAPAEAPAPVAPKVIGFAEKIALIKKKAEYINGKNMDPVAAEEQARKDLGFPPLTEAEKAQPASKNIFEKALDFFGLNEKLTAKPVVESGGSKVESGNVGSEKVASAPTPAAPTPIVPVENLTPVEPTPIVPTAPVAPTPVAPVQDSAPTESAPTVENEGEKPTV